MSFIYPLTCILSHPSIDIHPFITSSVHYAVQILGDSSSAVLWLGVKHQQKEALTLFTQEIAPAGTGMGTSTIFHKWTNEWMDYG